MEEGFGGGGTGEGGGGGGDREKGEGYAPEKGLGRMCRKRQEGKKGWGTGWVAMKEGFPRRERGWATISRRGCRGQ